MNNSFYSPRAAFNKYVEEQRKLNSQQTNASSSRIAQATNLASRSAPPTTLTRDQTPSKARTEQHPVESDMGLAFSNSGELFEHLATPNTANVSSPKSPASGTKAKEDEDEYEDIPVVESDEEPMNNFQESEDNFFVDNDDAFSQYFATPPENAELARQRAQANGRPRRGRFNLPPANTDANEYSMLESNTPSTTADHEANPANRVHSLDESCGSTYDAVNNDLVPQEPDDFEPLGSDPLRDERMFQDMLGRIHAGNNTFAQHATQVQHQHQNQEPSQGRLATMIQRTRSSRLVSSLPSVRSLTSLPSRTHLPGSRTAINLIREAKRKIKDVAPK